MQVLVFRSDIELKEKLIDLGPFLNKHSDILKWSVDFEDIDRVMRVEATKNLSEIKLIEMVKPYGIQIEPLPE